MGAEICSEWGDGGEWGEWGDEGGAISRRGLRRGAVTRPFRAADLLRALAAAETTVYVETDSAGYLCAAGRGGGAALCVRAALARSVPAHSLQLRAAHAPPSHARRHEPLLQLRLEAACAPHAALRVWLDERLRAALGVPHLALCNIRGEKEYACHVCGARFADPNPLKAHLFLQCAVPARRPFWRLVAARLQACSPGPGPGPARLEALAAAYGGARHACVYCGKLYSRKYGLKIHIRTHTGYRPLRCRHCARAFGDPSNLNKHVRLHAARALPPAPPAPAPHLRLSPL